MKILFAYMGAENLGIEYLASIVRNAGHSAELAFDPALFNGQLMWDVPFLARMFDIRPKIVSKILTEKPDYVAYSCFTGNYRWALSIAEEIKKSDPYIKNLFGGVHVSAVPEKVIAQECVDAIAVGEADPVFLELIESIENDTVHVPPGVWIKNRNGEIRKGINPQLPVDLDTIPYPSKDLFYDKVPALQSHYMIMTSRGCPYNCTYCYKSLSAYSPEGVNPIRRRSVENVIGELVEAKEKWNLKIVVFRDDVFTLQKKWLREFCHEYKERIDLPFFCYTHPAALDSETADLIKESGCFFVTMGIQSVDEKQRKEVLNRNYTNEQVKRSMDLLKNRKIIVSVDHIIGLPGDTPENMKNALVFYNEIRPDRLLTFWLTYYPGTEIMEKALRAGLITSEDKERIEDGYGGHRYSGGGASKISNPIKRFPFFFALIPLFGQKLTRILFKAGFEKICPSSYAAHNILLSLKALISGDTFFKYNIKYLLAKKKVP